MSGGRRLRALSILHFALGRICASWVSDCTAAVLDVKANRELKYICLGYLEPGKFEKMSESEAGGAPSHVALAPCLYGCRILHRLCEGCAAYPPPPHITNSKDVTVWQSAVALRS
jgi:hypothetical protein